VAVEGQQPVDTLCSRCSVIIEVLDPIQAHSVVGPAVIRCCDTPVSWKVALLVPIAEVVLRSKNDEWRYGPALGLIFLGSLSPIRGCQVERVLPSQSHPRS
jgi:hypothetical protein